ncbi:RNA-binding protein [Variovorax humicola]|uniref:RNA-binding protein n=1 Tax=Variovorax humicola TaxID=1769758 RepID=A0ABU8W3E6_9BURK
MQQLHIVIGNLPDDITEDGIREALSSFAKADKIRLANESGTPTALIDVVEMSRAQAESLAQRINGRSYQGRVLRAWVPKMDW